MWLYVKKVASTLCVLALIFSLNLHSLQVEHSHFNMTVSNTAVSVVTDTHVHEHHSEDDHNVSHSHQTINTNASEALSVAHGQRDGEHSNTESLADKMHVAEKKFIFFLLGATLIVFAFKEPTQMLYTRIRLFLYNKIRSTQRGLMQILFSYIRLFFATGILNPKLF
jgi:hypothetical protein